MTQLRASNGHIGCARAASTEVIASASYPAPPPIKLIISTRSPSCKLCRSKFCRSTI